MSRPSSPLPPPQRAMSSPLEREKGALIKMVSWDFEGGGGVLAATLTVRRGWGRRVHMWPPRSGPGSVISPARLQVGESTFIPNFPLKQ